MASLQPLTPPDPSDPMAALARLEARLARIEAHLHLEEPEVAPAGAPAPLVPCPDVPQDDLEYRIGQEWFSRVGVAALAFGVAFTLSLPYRSVPSYVPSLVGYLLVAMLAGIILASARRFELVSGNLRATAMGLAYFSGLRLGFLGGPHTLDGGSLASTLVLSGTACVNLVVAYRRGSSWLFALALVTAFTTVVAAGSFGVGLLLIALFTVMAVAASVSLQKPSVILMAMPLSYASYLILALDNPFMGGTLQVVAGPAWGPGVLVICLMIYSRGLRLGLRDDTESMLVTAGVILNALGGYSVYLLHTVVSYEGTFAGYQVAAAAGLLGLAFLHSRELDRVGAFICAMTGFLALSVAIIKATQPPDVFVWLSVQSVIVVAIAIWLRSRFIIVANFVIYVAILACYVIDAKQERGISLGFGLVALVTARLLGWKQERLELKTEFMRNAYLVAVFFIFPYSLYHLVPGAWVGLAWVGAALLYYGLSALLRLPKYRWMGHATLLLTAVYMVVAGLGRLDPLFRNLSLLVLGAVLVIVSLVFTRLRTKRS